MNSQQKRWSFDTLLRAGWIYEYNNDYLNSDKIANIYFTGGVDARNRVRDLNEYNKIHLNEMGRKNMPDDGAFNISQNSYHNVDNDVESNVKW